MLGAHTIKVSLYTMAPTRVKEDTSEMTKCERQREMAKKKHMNDEHMSIHGSMRHAIISLHTHWWIDERTTTHSKLMNCDLTEERNKVKNK